MCDPVSMALMAAGTAASTMADAQAAKKQERAIGAAENRRVARQKEISAVVDQLLNQYNPDKRAETRQTGAEQVQQSLDAAVDASQDVSPVGAEFSGRTSDDFIETAAARKSEELGRTKRIAQILGQIGGATRGREMEGYKIGDANADIGQLGNFARGDARVDALRIQEAGRPNPFLKLLGGAAQGAGMAAGSIPGGGGTTAVGGAAAGTAPVAAGPLARKTVPTITVPALS